MTTITGKVVELVSNPLSFILMGDDGEETLCFLNDTPEWVTVARRVFGKVVSVTGEMHRSGGLMVLTVESAEFQATLEEAQ